MNVPEGVARFDEEGTAGEDKEQAGPKQQPISREMLGSGLSFRAHDSGSR